MKLATEPDTTHTNAAQPDTSVVSESSSIPDWLPTDFEGRSDLAKTVRKYAFLMARSVDLNFKPTDLSLAVQVPQGVTGAHKFVQSIDYLSFDIMYADEVTAQSQLNSPANAALVEAALLTAQNGSLRTVEEGLSGAKTPPSMREPGDNAERS